ncbi:MAG TPA: helix-turn-helix domain-containing protein [Beijerinckiaceae bacterium]|jgi:transcriptional regulator GlxA family with amidase domain
MRETVPVFVVLPPRTLLLDVAGPVEVLRKANQVQDRITFEVAFVGPWGSLASSIGLTLAAIAPLPENLPEGALVVVSGSADPPGEGDPADEAAEAAIVAWLEGAIRPGIRLVTICSGAMLAARAGLLDGHACTTHFGLCAELATAAPRARVLEDRLFVEDGERLTSAGVTAGIDLMLHLVQGLAGPAAAAAVARALVVYLRRAGSDPQLSPFLVGRNHLHPAVHRVQDLIAADPAKAWTLEMLAASAGASPRHLSRLFNEHAGMSIPDYVNGLRVALARELLNQTRLDMERVAERAGFASPRQLRRAWSRHHPEPPRMARAAR